MVEGTQTRENLEDYSIGKRPQAITTSGAILSYVSIPFSLTLNRVTSHPTFVLYGVFRYIFLVTSHGEGGAPDETLLKDKPILINGALYVMTAVLVLMSMG